MRNMFLSVMIIALSLNSCGRDDNPTINNNQPTPAPPISKPNVQQGKRPQDSDIGTKGYAKDWKISEDNYVTIIDIADLYNNPKNIIDILKKEVNFIVSNPEQNDYYLLKDEDIIHLDITDIKYDGKEISFYTKYKEVKSTIKSRLPFNAINFYNKKIAVNESYVSNHYMRGIYENLPVGLGNLLTYDKNRFSIDLANDGRYKDDNNNSLILNIEIKDKSINDINKQTIKIAKNINSFKTLKQLSDDLLILHNVNFREAIKTRISKLKDQNKTDLTDVLKATFVNNLTQYIAIELKSDGSSMLNWDSDKLLTGGQGHSDIYLQNPRFTLTSAVIRGNDLHIKIQFQEANDVIINTEHSMIINNIKP